MTESISNGVRYNYYFYYGDNTNGSDVLDGGTYSNYKLNVVWYRGNITAQTGTITYSNYTNYFGLTCNHILDFTSFSDMECRTLFTRPDYYGGTQIRQFYIPSELLNYQSQAIYDYFVGGKTLQQIEQQLEQANATLSDINNALTDDSFDDTQENPIEMEIFEDYNEDYQDNLFNNVLERFKTNIPNSTSSIYSINIPIPHSNGQQITLYSNAISKYINYFNQPMLYTFIQACWYVVFFKYFFWFGKKVLDWILTGELLEKGGGAFIKSLEKENAVVNAAMM